ISTYRAAGSSRSVLASVFAKPYTVASGVDRSCAPIETICAKRSSSAISPLGTVGTVQQERLTAGADLQASTPEVRIGLSRAGVTGVQKAVRMQHGGGDALVSAEIDCFVDLDPAQKGVHMSRFPEVFEEAIDEVVIEEKLLIENLAEHIARKIVERQ